MTHYSQYSSRRDDARRRPAWSSCMVLVLASIVPCEAKNCTARQLACKPSCSASSSGSKGKDQLGNAAVLQSRRCKLCKCKKCEECKAHDQGDEEDPVLSIVQHPGSRPGAKLVAKKTSRIISGSKKPRRKANVTSTGKAKKRRRPQGRVSRTTANAVIGAAKVGDASTHRNDRLHANDNDSADHGERRRVAALENPLADLIGQVLLGISLGGLVLASAATLRNLASAHVWRRGVTVGDGMGASPEPSPRLLATEQSSPPRRL
jgi:hypothetical protein